jgi:hypothetical protein
MVMQVKYIIACLLVLVLVIVIMLMRRTVMESFEDFAEGGMTMNDIANAQRQDYIEIGKRRYNRFADSYDVSRPGFAGSLEPSDVKKLDAQLKGAIRSADLLTADPRNSDSKTGLVFQTLGVRESIPPESLILKEARKCEAHKTRDACSILGKTDTARCGVCIKGGTDAFEKTPDKHIGGMLILENDRIMAETEAKDAGTAPVYSPTVGSCPSGYFFVDYNTCVKEVNRLNCKESGETGGFKGGVTIEGRRVADTSCATCPSAVMENTFIYEPKENGLRKFKPQLRILTPVGTGMNKVKVYNTQNRLLGEATGVGGTELLVNFSNVVTEAENVKIIINQQYPHRPRGKHEAFLISQYGSTKVNMDSVMADKICKMAGTALATKEQLIGAYNAGAQTCKGGIVSDSLFTKNIMQGVHDEKKCGTSIGVNNLTDSKFDGAWCYGIKPPVGIYDGRLRVDEFYMPEDKMTPSQTETGPKRSMHGDDYEAPSYRGVIIQWEMGRGDPTKRRVGIESTITSVMDQPPSTITTDGFKLFRILRRMGTFSSSQMIVKPRPADAPYVMNTQYWIWSNQSRNAEFILTAQVPGTLMDPYYPEDSAICPRGPIIAKESTLNLLKISPCMKDGQTPGNYSIDCLTNLFRSVGGDPYSGTLSPQMGPTNQRTIMFTSDGKAREQDEIIEFLTEIVNIATTGRDSHGDLIGGNNKKERRRLINEAAQKMYGVNLVTACEDVAEDAVGNVILVKKTLPLDADCMDYLYTNAGYDVSRGQEASGTIGSLKATYENIMDRFSGLRKKEKDSKKENHPFMTCQRAGTIAPIRADGSVNNQWNTVINNNAMRMNGGIDAVQQYYNNVYKLANRSFNEKDIPTAEDVTATNNAMLQCYGIKPAEISPTSMLRAKCGVSARYIRILRSVSSLHTKNAIHSETHHGNGTYAIQISQLQVFDQNNNEIGRDKKATAFSVWKDGQGGSVPQRAVDGVAGSRSHPNQYHDNGLASNEDEQYWLLDLGDVHEIRKIVYYNRYDCCRHRAFHMPVQLLDADKQVLTVKNISNKAVRDGVETIVFTKEDIVPRIPTGNLRPDFSVSVRIETAIELNGCIHESNGAAITTQVSEQQQSQYMNRFGFIIRNALNGQSGAVSLEYLDIPGKYLTHAPNDTMRVIINDRISLPNTASWVIRPALNGAPGWVCFESCHAPGHYMTRAPRNSDMITLVRANSRSAPLLLHRNSWRVSRLQAANLESLK